jgi:hypothetical protein
MSNPFPLKQQLPIPSPGLVGIQPDFGIIHSGNKPRGSVMRQCPGRPGHWRMGGLASASASAERFSVTLISATGMIIASTEIADECPQLGRLASVL